MPIVSISIPEKLQDELDTSVEKRGFASRSEVLRHALRSFLKENQNIDNIKGEVIATVTAIYEKGSKNSKLLSILHEPIGIISTFLHTHVDEDSCLEVMVVRGNMQTVRDIRNMLNSNKQVKQVKISVVGTSSK